MGSKAEAVPVKRHDAARSDRRLLKWTVPEFQNFLVDPTQQNGAKERTSAIDSPNLSAAEKSDPGSPATSKKFHLEIKSIVDEKEESVRLQISGEILLVGPQRPRFSLVRSVYFPPAGVAYLAGNGLRS